MKLTSKDLGALKVPMLVMAISIAASFALVAFTSDQYSQSGKQYAGQLAALQEARTRLQRSGEERETVSHFLQAYRQLERIGFVGDERRLSWVESLRVANTQAGLFGVDYQLSAQEPYSHLAKDNPLSDRVKQSRMRISFGILHEGDLTKLLRAVSAQQPGVFAVNSCSLDRAGRMGAPVPKQANLSAECELSWLTIDPKGGKS
jgi:hypothetical protein